MEKGAVQYPGVKTVYAVEANNYVNDSSFTQSTIDKITLDSSMLEISTFDDENGISMDEYTITGKIAGISSNKPALINKKFVLKIDFYYNDTVMKIGTKQYPAILSIKSSTGQTGGNFIGSEITYNCKFPTVRKSPL